MVLPQSNQLTISAAADYVAKRCDVSREEARGWLKQAWQHSELLFFDRNNKVVTDFEGVINWEEDSVEVSGRSGRYSTGPLTVYREHLEDRLLDRPSPRVATPAPPPPVTETLPTSDAPPPPIRPAAKPGPGANAGRYVETDRKLFPEITRIMKETGNGHYTVVRQLRDRIQGSGEDESRIRRVAKRYAREEMGARNGRPTDGRSID